MRRAFTMIELVFVIVIIAILAVLAIPRLSATRDDAIASKLASNIMVGAGEISAYAMSHSNVSSDLTVMSNALKSLQDMGDAVFSNYKATVKAGNIDNCVVVSIDTNNSTGIDTLNVSFNDDNGDSLCKSLQSAIDPAQYPMKLRGGNVIY